MRIQNSGKIEMVVFDWAGTTVDYASSAPGDVFGRVFEQAGIFLTKPEINGPMGMEKKEHIRKLLSTESGNSQWEKKYGRGWNEDDVQEIFERFEHTLGGVVADYSTVLPGVTETVDILRSRGIRIGSTTGYLSDIMEKVTPAARAGGYEPDCVVTPDMVGSGRPGPFMIFECMRQLQVYPPCSVVKVGDTVVDILEGVNAGTWSIGILTGSNLLGLTEEDYKKMDAGELAARKKKAARIYLDAGADAVIDRITELPAAIETISQKMNTEG